MLDLFRNFATFFCFVNKKQTNKHNAKQKGLVIYYPNQTCDGSIPSTYPPSIRIVSHDVSVLNIEILNSWIGIYATDAARHYISRILGQPIKIGIFIDSTHDIGRIENVHFNPWFCNNINYTSIQAYHGVSFIFGATDWQYVFNTFSYLYSVGYQFIQTKNGNIFIQQFA